jgi:hypothetical protein
MYTLMCLLSLASALYCTYIYMESDTLNNLDQNLLLQHEPGLFARIRIRFQPRKKTASGSQFVSTGSSVARSR